MPEILMHSTITMRSKSGSMVPPLILVFWEHTDNGNGKWKYNRIWCFFIDHELNQQLITLFFTRKEPGGLEEQSVLRLDPGLNTAHNWHNLFLINFFVTQKMYCYESAGLMCVERRYGEWVDKTGSTWLLKVMNFIRGHEFFKMLF